MNVLYVDREERVRAGRLVADRQGERLTTRAGRPLAPADVLAVLASRGPGPEERAACHRVSDAGYRVETV